ncbi:MAG: hypothetical protein OXU36_11620 [Candidatus Poribacteria bacterium]|nr:hypothetical protein [Candidatus Poribacteria bacterium]
MEILDQGKEIDAEAIEDKADDIVEQRTVVRFQKGVDFETFEDFRELFLSILKSSELSKGEKRIEKITESDTPSQLRTLPKFGALEMTFPNSILDFDKLYSRIRESQITIEKMRESGLYVENLTTTLFQVGWPGGTLTLRCTGVPKISEEANVEIKSTMQQFSSDCQMMLIWFAAILGSQNAMRDHLNHIAKQDEPFTINTYRPDGRVDSVLARVSVDSVISAFTEAGDFERLYAKAFVVFTYQIWEEVARPKIATALKVEKPDYITANLMGDWRHLRNWLVHRTKKAESDFFSKAKTLQMVLNMQPGDPSLTANGVATLMQQLNHMQVDVNPQSLDFGLERSPIDVSMIADLAKGMEAGQQIALPEALMYPSGVSIVFNDGPTATIHERDCSYADKDFRSLDGGCLLVVTSRELARGVLEHLGKTEHKCVHCTR